MQPFLYLIYDKLKKALIYLYYSIPPNENDFLSLAHSGERVAAQAALFTQFLDLIGTLFPCGGSVLPLQV